MPITPGFELTKKNILTRITEEQIFEKYLGLQVDEGVNLINPLRIDNRPSCRFYIASNGRPYFKDFGKFHWDCFNVVEYKYGVSFIEALKIIVKDFDIKEIEANYSNNDRVIPIKQRATIKIALRKWTNADAIFWKEGNIELDYLSEWSVYPCKSIWINNEHYICHPNDPCYCYYFGNELYKLYFPKRQYNRFFQNINQVTDDLTQGWNKLPKTEEVLILQKSYKDVISMSTFGITADAVLSENHLIKSDKMANYKSRFKYIFTLFDYDQVGRNLAIKYYKAYNIPYLMFPNTWEKDWFANVKKFGPERIKEIIEEWKSINLE